MPSIVGQLASVPLRHVVPLWEATLPDHIQSYGSYGLVTTTLDLHDELLLRAKRHAKQTGRPLRAVVEEGLRRVLASARSDHRYRLPD